MLTLTNKKLKELANVLHAERLTDEHLTHKQTIAISTGLYGINGAIFRSLDERDKFYYIPTRSTLLFYYV